MSRHVELLNKFAHEAGLNLYIDRSGLSEAEYVEVGKDDSDERVKIRIANHETRPTYGRLHGYADYDACATLRGCQNKTASAISYQSYMQLSTAE